MSIPRRSETGLKTVSAVLSMACAAFLFTGSCAPSASTPADTAAVAAAGGVLTVDDGSIVDGNGRPVMLRGVNMDLFYHLIGDDTSRPFTYAGREDVRLLSEMGANALRLCLNWKLFADTSGYALVDDYLEWCREEGMYLILDMHVVPPNDRAAGTGVWDEGGGMLADLWGEIAAVYAGEPMIAGYDIYNEPRPPHRVQWWVLSREIISSIREQDPDHIIFVDMVGYWEEGFRPYDDPGVVYTIHFYRPFPVTHWGATWGDDAPVPPGTVYPGEVLTAVKTVSSSEETALETPAGDWTRLDTGVLRPDEDAEWAGFRLGASGNTGMVQFDDLELEVNGASFQVWNPDFEEPSPARGPWPSTWYYSAEGDFRAEWGEVGRTSGRTSGRSAVLEGSTGSASWYQATKRTGPLVSLDGVDSLRLSCWVRAPENRGSVTLRADYLRGEYEYFDRDAILDAISPAADFAHRQGSPLYVGELGVINGAPQDSRVRLARDMLSVMNQLGLHWTWWTYRGAGDLSFGFKRDDGSMDTGMVMVLEEALRE
ncbi:MAG: hypothetical protein AVO35_02240 [Candidatus Aegiribacteria sp. MLS_C]|nr:MAG: hypothetical protein AVO35_02240 [Candidatus Aegiribacteria sp. MLS_C]